MNVMTQLEEVEGRFLQEKVFAQAYALFGGLALLVASIGLFGVMSYSVARRTNEIGIRMTLGARTRDVMGLVMRESMVLVAVGVAIGVAAAIAASRLVAESPVRAHADRSAGDGRSDYGDAGRVGARRLSARPARVEGRPDGGVSLRVERHRRNCRERRV